MKRAAATASRLPLRVRLVALLTALLALGLAAAGLAAVNQLRSYLVQRVDAQLVEYVTSPQFEGYLNRLINNPGQQPSPDGRLPLPSAYYVRVTDAAGGTYAESASPFAKREPDLPRLTPQQAAARGGKPFTTRSSGSGPSWRVVAVPLQDQSGSTFVGYVAADMTDIQATLRQLALLQLLIGLAVLAAMAGLGYYVVRRSLRPLAEVQATAERITAGDMTPRVPAMDPRTEVGAVAGAMNTMLGEVEQALREREVSEQEARRSEERMRRFVADASHELRTPLTSIRGFAELYRQGAVGSPEDLERVMGRIEGEAARMGLLVDDLLLLARLDQKRPLEQHPVDLLPLAADAVHDAGAHDPSRPVQLVRLDGDEPPVVLGDEARLRQVVGNLVTNALTHTPRGTPVEVRVGSRTLEGAAGEAVLEVADLGPGLPPEAAVRVFERFYRSDATRTRASGGTGLGLSIVEALVTAHGGRVELDTAPGQGATFRVLLPLARSAAVPPAATAPQPA